ncbi:hypothetical protein [Paenibacillus polymyxa]|uniref:hypothetical protein n=1 Tax=Paenibacillus polymyxa TaxID=1406 RepID=UPI0012B62F43|nr:hypothetical protein [Paenibacillus polymyxa]MBE7901184.1 hypothetical protein [Paenibacillus polymyxa]MDN4088519.1 hypothetical protein [Paenibacillus polymyxa]QPK54082.1 hypothetical protein G7035_16260 [Paenibacillus polymyxa]
MTLIEGYFRAESPNNKFTLRAYALCPAGGFQGSGSSRTTLYWLSLTTRSLSLT